MKKWLLSLLVLLGVKGEAFVEKPWFPFPYELHFRADYDLSYFPAVDGGYNPSNYSSWNHVLRGNLGFTSLSQIDFQLEAEGFITSKSNATMMSIGAQVRKLLYDDIQGDPVSLSVGFITRYVPDHARLDVFCPYAGLVNFELNSAVGKEFDHLQDWVYRFYGVATLGQSVVGRPWIKGDVAFEVNDRENCHQAGLKMLSGFGFGQYDRVNIDQFNGYATVWHQNIDLVAQYRRVFRIWGTLGVDLGYRLYAENYPRNELFARFSYDLPFSPF